MKAVMDQQGQSGGLRHRDKASWKLEKTRGDYGDFIDHITSGGSDLWATEQRTWNPITYRITAIESRQRNILRGNIINIINKGNQTRCESLHISRLQYPPIWKRLFWLNTSEFMNHCLESQCKLVDSARGCKAEVVVLKVCDLSARMSHKRGVSQPCSTIRCLESWRYIAKICSFPIYFDALLLWWFSAVYLRLPKIGMGLI